MISKWDALLTKFRNLGGVADNICQREGKNGRGIFPINFEHKSKIFTPSNLIIKKNDIYLENEKVRIKDESIYHKDTIDFFNFYQDNFSWGGGGRETTESFESSNSGMDKYTKKLDLF